MDKSINSFDCTLSFNEQPEGYASQKNGGEECISFCLDKSDIEYVISPKSICLNAFNLNAEHRLSPLLSHAGRSQPPQKQQSLLENGPVCKEPEATTE